MGALGGRQRLFRRERPGTVWGQHNIHHEDAAEDYAKLLRNNPRFRTCFLYTNSSKFAVVLARNGYATDPSYSAKLNAIIRAHKLDQYDNRRAD